VGQPVRTDVNSNCVMNPTHGSLCQKVICDK
jgi:hypothetical protein